jgi:hypothetical protein
VRDQAGVERLGWVHCGSWFAGVLSNKVGSRWDEEWVFLMGTERLRLRPFAERDVDAIYTLVYADSRVREAWSGYVYA